MLEKTFQSSLNCKEIKSVNPKGNRTWISIGRTDAEAEAPILWPPDGKSQLIGKDPDVGKDWGQEEKGVTEDEMAGWHHWLSGRECEWTPGVGDGQGSLVCCDSWGRKELDMIEQLIWSDLIWYLNGLVVFPTFFNLSEFYNKEFMIWATVSSQFCFCDCVELLHLWLQRI